MRSGALGDIVRDPLDDVTSDWTRAITDLVTATQGMLRQISGSINDAQDAITRGSRAASSVGGMVNGVLTPELQTTNRRWLTALEQYQAAYNVATGQRADLDYNPNDVTRPATPTIPAFTPSGLRVGSTTIPWWLVVIGGLASLAAMSKSKGAAQWR